MISWFTPYALAESRSPREKHTMYVSLGEGIEPRPLVLGPRLSATLPRQRQCIVF